MLHKLKIEVCEANLALRDAGLVILTWGNVSARDPNGDHIVIKPSGVSYDKMLPEQMVVLTLDGSVVEGDFKPSSDTPTHLELYRAWPEVSGVVHTHSTYATAWAQARRSLPCYGTTHADSFLGAVPITDALRPDEIAGDYEAATGRIIVRAFEGMSPMEVPAALVGGHGPFTWGRCAAQAVENSIVLEQVALTAMLTERLRPQATEIDDVLRDKHFLRKHGPGAYYGQRRG
ncbi:MAG: L-ribulose-5-phosphate 4-epimerase AraD [Armatimonadetes bacterium]|nr:L-ribulose-5-phosphate 4-epimerase AraD [Armatimonadota bacterium]